MNDTRQDVWFYAREGERIGPVTFAELRVKVAEAALNPRLDMVWTHGMAEWKPAADPYTPPQQESPEFQQQIRNVVRAVSAPKP
jgi:hypothetical protein